MHDPQEATAATAPGTVQMQLAFIAAACVAGRSICAIMASRPIYGRPPGRRRFLRHLQAAGSRSYELLRPHQHVVNLAYGVSPREPEDEDWTKPLPPTVDGL